MLQHDIYLVQEALDASQWRQRDAEHWAVRKALRLHERACQRGWMQRVWSALTGRPFGLFDLSDVKPSQARPGYRGVGARAVPIAQIRGSEGRCGDFDGTFNPLQSHSKARWLGIAVARLMGMPLPPVELVQIGDVYFVLDGHHRISVAQALGQREIDAVVSVWRVTGPLPWEQGLAADRLARQPA